MNSWRARNLMLILTLAVLMGHGAATASLPNTPGAMLLFHGSAALFDWLLLIVTPYLLAGRLCDDMQWLLLASILGNAFGWILYMAYVPPSLYNTCMWGLTCAQWLRLFIPDSHASHHLRDALVHRGAGVRSGWHS